MGDLPRHSVSVTGIVFHDDGRVLAIQRSDDGRWVPPGGVLELSETPTDGVAREVLEETSVHVKVDQLTGVYKNMARGMVTLAFRCYATGGETHPTSEARQVAWLTVHEATRDMVEARAIRITDALSGNGSFVRIRDGNGIRKIRLHSIRHTTASLLKDLKVPARDAQIILGHAHISTTQQIYTHVDETARRKALTRLNKLLGGTK